MDAGERPLLLTAGALSAQAGGVSRHLDSPRVGDPRSSVATAHDANAARVIERESAFLERGIHSTPITFGKPRPVSDLFGLKGRELLDRLEIPAPWRETLDASLYLIDYLESEIAAIERELRASGAHHPYVPLLSTVPGVGWVLAFTIAAG